LLQAFDHLLDRELISFGDNRGRNQTLDFIAMFVAFIPLHLILLREK